MFILFLSIRTDVDFYRPSLDEMMLKFFFVGHFFFVELDGCAEEAFFLVHKSDWVALM